MSRVFRSLFPLSTHPSQKHILIQATTKTTIFLRQLYDFLHSNDNNGEPIYLDSKISKSKMVTKSKSSRTTSRTTPPRTKGPDNLPPTPDSTSYNPRKRGFVMDPTYSPTRDKHGSDVLASDAHDDDQMRREAVAERPSRKVKIVDPTYNPRYEAGDTDEGTTRTQVSPGKRKFVDVSGHHPGTKRARTFRTPSPFPTPTSVSEESNRKRKGTLKSQKDESYTPSEVPKASNPKASLNAKGRGEDDGASDEDEEYTQTADVSKSEKKTAYDFSLERARRWAAAVSLPGTWSRAEKELFFRLAMRGFEPLLPQHWRHDFSTLPETLFSSSKNGKVPVVWPFRELDFHAIKSLGGLFALGGQVRDCSVLQNRPEVKIKQAIKKYIKWAFRDAGIQNNTGAIPTYTIHAQEEGESVVAAIKKLNRRLGNLCKRYQEALGESSQTKSQHSRGLDSNTNTAVKQEMEDATSEPFARFFPLLVGFVICGPIVAILTLDTDPLSPKDLSDGDIGSNFISQFDVGEHGQDVWTSLAVAITTMHIRQTMVTLAGDRGGLSRPTGNVP